MEFTLFYTFRDSLLGGTKEKSLVDYQKSVELIVMHVIRQWLMPLRGTDRGSNEDYWLNEAIVNFLKIVNIDHVMIKHNKLT